MHTAEFAQLVLVLGVPVLHRTVSGITTGMRGIVQSTARAPEAIVNAYGVNGVSVQVLSSSMPAPPVKFDSLDIGGEVYTVDSVVAKRETVSGTVMGWVMYCKGR